MYSKDDINKLYREIAASIDISDDMFTAAVDEYESLGKWIDENTPQYQISIYPQGSFGLGTVVKPITDEDDYDLDIVCQFKEQYGLTAILRISVDAGMLSMRKFRTFIWMLFLHTQMQSLKG